MKIFTIGFTGKTAEEFFGLMNDSGARYLADIRIHNNSQLAGFTKRTNIKFFVDRLTKMEYVEMPIFAPEEEAFKRYRKDKDWDHYETTYVKLLDERAVTDQIDNEIFAAGVILLCSEPTAEKCHRRLAAEYLETHAFHEVEIVHL